MLWGEHERFLEQSISKRELIEHATSEIRRDTYYVEQRFAAEHGIEFHEQLLLDDPEIGVQFDQFLEMVGYEKVSEALDNLVERTESRADKIAIWRCITVSRHWMETEMLSRPLGICWSYDPSFAKAHFGSYGHGSEVSLVIEGLVDIQDVDWQRTVLLNAVDEFTTGEEREIRLRDDAFVELVSLRFSHEDGIRDVTRFDLHLAVGTEARQAAFAI
jgi:hypothetical protein